MAQESVHAGLFDKGADPSLLVAIELLCVRYIWDEADYLWLTQRVPDEEWFLSCSLNLMWPDPSWVDTNPAGLDRAAIVAPSRTHLPHDYQHASRSSQSHVEETDSRDG